MSLGVLALQGDFAAHSRALGRLGVPVREVRRVHELADLAGLVIPGGESTTLLNLMADEAWADALRRFHETGGALFGTCAGAILLAREVRNPAQPSLGLLDAVVVRNAYGRQVDSFVAAVQAPWAGPPLEAVFIRAPRFAELGPDVEVLGRLGSEPVLVRQGRVLAASFHSELTADSRLHQLFAALALRGSLPAPVVDQAGGSNALDARDAVDRGRLPGDRPPGAGMLPIVPDCGP